MFFLLGVGCNCGKCYDWNYSVPQSKCKVCGSKRGALPEKRIYQPAHCPLICPKNFDNYSPDFWENGFDY